MGSLQDIIRRVFAQRLVYRVLAWTLTLGVAQISLYGAWHSFDNAYVNAQRKDGNAGHATIDFGGQYLMGRLLVEGHGRDLYDRGQQRLTLAGIYPTDDENPKAERSEEVFKQLKKNAGFNTCGSKKTKQPANKVACCLLLPPEENIASGYVCSPKSDTKCANLGGTSLGTGSSCFPATTNPCRFPASPSGAFLDD